MSGSGGHPGPRGGFFYPNQPQQQQQQHYHHQNQQRQQQQQQYPQPQHHSEGGGYGGPGRDEGRDRGGFYAQHQHYQPPQRGVGVHHQHPQRFHQAQAPGVPRSFGGQHPGPLVRVFVGNIPSQMSEQDVLQFFEVNLRARGAVGPMELNSVVRLCAPKINRDKNFTFVEFTSPEYATAAMSLDNSPIPGGSIRVRRTKDYAPYVAKNNLDDGAGSGNYSSSNNANLNASTNYFNRSGSSSSSSSSSSISNINNNNSHSGTIDRQVPDHPDKIFISGIPFRAPDDEVIAFLQRVGPLEAFFLPKDLKRDGHPGRGFAFALYVSAREHADRAVAELNGLELGGREVSVQRQHENAPGEALPEGATEFLDMTSSPSVGLGRMMPEMLRGVFVTDEGFEAPSKVVGLINAVTLLEAMDEELRAGVVRAVEDFANQFTRAPVMALCMPPQMKQSGEFEIRDLERGAALMLVRCETKDDALIVAREIGGRKVHGKTVITCFVDAIQFMTAQDRAEEVARANSEVRKLRKMSVSAVKKSEQGHLIMAPIAPEEVLQSKNPFAQDRNQQKFIKN